MGSRRGKGEQGIAALELLLALPVLMLVLAGIASMVTTAARDYILLREQEEVQQEMQLAFARVLDDCLMATRVTRGNNDESIKIYSGDSILREYFVYTDRKGMRKLVENVSTLPMTGNHAWIGVIVDSFNYEAVDPEGRPGLYRLWLQGRSTRAGSVPYKLVTEFYVPGDGGGKSP